MRDPPAKSGTGSNAASEQPLGLFWPRRQCPSHEGHDRVGSGQYIRRCEAQQAVARIDQSILTPVVTS